MILVISFTYISFSVTMELNCAALKNMPFKDLEIDPTPPHEAQHNYSTFFILLNIILNGGFC